MSMNACNTFGESLLHMACRRGDVSIVRLLVNEFKVRVEVRDDYGRTPLHDACWTTTPNFEVMDVLMGAVEARLLLAEDVRGHTPFDYARREHWDKWIRFLEERKAKLIAPEGCDDTAAVAAGTGASADATTATVATDSATAATGEQILPDKTESRQHQTGSEVLTS